MLRSPHEFREVMDRAFTMLSTDPEMGPALHDADVPQRFEFPDVDLVVNIHNAPERGRTGHYLAWEWSDEVDWEPDVKMSMDSEVANRYFQGKVNVPMAIARRRIKASGNIKKALEIIPITKPVFAQYRAMIATEYAHLLA
jgi:hypothetical protein